MQRLSQRDWERANEVVRRLYGQQNMAGLRRCVLEALTELVRCDYSSYNEFDFAAGHAVVHLGAEAPEITQRLPIFEQFIGRDPHVLYTARTGDCSARQVVDLVSQRQFREHPIYREFYKELSVEHRAAFFLRREETLDLAVALLRTGPAFSARELALMEVLRPHIEQAYLNVQRIERMQRYQSHQDAVLEHSIYASALLDSEARPLWISPRAEQWLRKYFPCAIPNSGLPEQLRQWTLQERRRLEAPEYKRPAVPFEMVRPESRLIIQLAHRPEGGFLLLFEEEEFSLSAAKLQHLGLTGREAEVLYWAAQGKSNPEIALLLEMSRRTVDKHMEHILAKLGVETRAAAAQIVQNSRRPGAPSR
jgi:DNA-binding CsgD family transcriptional regulator